eukprot:scaffold120817_cov67-Cyclotella_meneghiniana.AAC.2
MVMVSEGDVSRLCVSKEPVRSKVTVSEDMGRKAVRREGMAAVRRMRREAPLLANILSVVKFVLMNSHVTHIDGDGFCESTSNYNSHGMDKIGLSVATITVARLRLRGKSSKQY